MALSFRGCDHAAEFIGQISTGFQKHALLIFGQRIEHVFVHEDADAANLAPVQQGVVVHDFGLLQRCNGVGIPLATVDQPSVEPLVRVINGHVDHVRAFVAKDLTVGPCTTYFFARDISDRTDRVAFTTDVHLAGGPCPDVDKVLVCQVVRNRWVRTHQLVRGAHTDPGIGVVYGQISDAIGGHFLRVIDSDHRPHVSHTVTDRLYGSVRFEQRAAPLDVQTQIVFRPLGHLVREPLQGVCAGTAIRACFAVDQDGFGTGNGGCNTHCGCEG
tara:strand:+ start:229 stop:1044 length:816 start_codon:yes stop_codon:yes gene_type:complete